MKIKKGLIVLSIMSSLVMHTYGAPTNKSVDQLFRESVVVPISYDKKMYIKGNYCEDDTAYKIEKVNGEYYIPIRLWMSALQNTSGEDWWQLNVGTTEPLQIDLVSWIGKRHKGGWSNTNEVRTTIKLTVGNQTALKNKQEVKLPHAPTRVNGQVCLSIPALEQLFGLEISEEAGLLFIGKDEVQVTTQADQAVVKQIVQALQEGKQKGAETKYIDHAVYADKKTYYITDEQMPGLEEWKKHLWVRTGDGKIREIKLPADAKVWSEPSHLTSERLYYTRIKEGDTYLCALDLATEQSVELANLTQKAYWKQEDWGWLGPIYEASGKVYSTLHMGDYTMGGETLYEISNGDVKEIVNTKYFSDIEFVGHKLYYIERDNWGGTNNIYELDLQTLDKKTVGHSDYEYSELTFKDEVLYTTARKVDKTLEVYEEECLYRLELASSQQEKLTRPTYKYWVEDRVYYVDEETQYLIGVDLDGENKKTILAKPIKQIEKQGNKFYYLLEGYVPGIFKYDLTTGITQPVLTQYMDKIVVLSDTVLGISNGYNPGIFKVENGKTTQKVKGLVDQSLVNISNMIYTLYGENEIHFMH